MSLFSRKKKNRKGVLQPLLVYLLPLLNLILLLFLKHFSHGISVYETNFSYIGNALNIGFCLSILSTTLILHLNNAALFESNGKRTIKILLIAIASILIAGLIQYSGLHLSNIYVLGVFGEKILVGFFYIINQGLILILTFYFWSLITKSKSLIWLRTMVNSSIIMLLLFLFSFFYSQRFQKTDIEFAENTSKADIAVVLGAAVWTGNKPSDILTLRVNKAAEIYNKGKTERIQLTGSNAPGELSEAEVAFNYIKNFNIPEKDIYLETETTSTTEQVKFIKNNLINTKGFKNIIVISEKFHLKRVKEVGKFFKINVHLVNSDIKLNSRKLIYYKLREGIALLMFWLFAI